MSSTTTTIPAKDVRPGMTVRMVGRGRKNRTTLDVQHARPHQGWLRVSGVNVNARYGTSNRLALDVHEDTMVEVVQA